MKKSVIDALVWCLLRSKKKSSESNEERHHKLFISFLFNKNPLYKYTKHINSRISLEMLKNFRNALKIFFIIYFRGGFIDCIRQTIARGGGTCS